MLFSLVNPCCSSFKQTKLCRLERARTRDQAGTPARVGARAREHAGAEHTGKSYKKNYTGVRELARSCLRVRNIAALEAIERTLLDYNIKLDFL